MWVRGNRSFFVAVLNYLREVNTQEVGLKQQSVNISVEHSLETEGKMRDKKSVPDHPTSLDFNIIKNFTNSNFSEGETIAHIWNSQSSAISQARWKVD